MPRGHKPQQPFRVTLLCPAPSLGAILLAVEGAGGEVETIGSAKLPTPAKVPPPDPPGRKAPPAKQKRGHLRRKRRAAQIAAPGETERVIIECLTRNRGMATTVEIQAAAVEAGVALNSIRNRLSRLIARGILLRPERGQYVLNKEK